MISGSFATTGSTQTRTTLSYINDLVTDAIAQGVYRIVVPNQYMDDNMANVLRVTYGYQVQSRNTLMGTFDDYIISWAPPMPTATPMPTPYPTATPSPTPSQTPSPTETNYPTPYPSATPSATPAPSPTQSATPAPSPTVTSAHVDGVDFTIEWWIKTTNWTSPTYHPRPYSLGAFPAPNAVSIEGGGQHIYWWTGGSPKVDFNGLNLQPNTWYHMAVTRDNGQLAIYVDGVRKATATYNDAIPSAGNILTIGAEPGDSYVNGKITNFRWNSSVKYTGASFTVPTSPLTADSNTKLLLLATDNGTFLTDSSTSAKTVTNVGASWSSDSPFAGGVGGSIDFAGTGKVTVPASSDWDL